MFTMDRVPRSADEEAALLRSKPDGWEFLLFAAVLLRKLNRLEPKYRDHELGYVEPHGTRLDVFEASNLLQDAFRRARMMSENLNRVLATAPQELAFGKPGESGDPERIEHLADRLMDIYESFLDWAAALRGAAVPDVFEHAATLASSFVDRPIAQMRDFVHAVVAELDRLPQRIAAGDDSISIEMTLTISIDEKVETALKEELARVEARFPDYFAD